MRRILLGLTLLCAALLGTAHASPLTFGHVVLNTAGEQPELCLRFSAPLDTHAEAHYPDYLSLTPSLRPSVSATGSQLCLAGLSYGTDYTITLHAGLPAADGSRLDPIANGQDVLGEATTDSTGMVRFAAGLLRGQGGKVFFFEKKKQKTFGSWARAAG